MRRTLLIPTALLAATLVALPAATASAQSGSANPTPPPRQFPKATVAAVVSDLDDPAVDRAVLQATATATEAIGAKKPITATLSPDDAIRAARERGAEEYDIVVISGVDPAETITTARGYPNTIFIGVEQGAPCVTEDGLPDPALVCGGNAATVVRNYVSTDYRVDQAGYLAGIVAASVSRSGRIGAIGGWPDCADCNRYIRSFELGARSIDPNINLEVAYLTDDHPTVANLDRETGRAFAEAFIDVNQLDVVLAASGGSSQGVIEAACDAGILAVGTDVDRALEHPRLADCIVTSATRNYEDSIASGIYEVSRAFREGDIIVGGGRFWDLLNGGVGLAPSYDLTSSLPPEVPTRLEEAIADIRAGAVQTCSADCASPVGIPVEATTEVEGAVEGGDAADPQGSAGDA